MEINKRKALILGMFEREVISVLKEPKILTSGQFSNYYSNTERLNGGKEGSDATVRIIDSRLTEDINDSLEIPKLVSDKLECDYGNDPIFKFVIDSLCEEISKLNLDEVDFISGGARRDWIFSLPVARKLQIPHLSILKDQKVILSDWDGRQAHFETQFCERVNTVHITDIVTEASSHQRIWIPALQKVGALMMHNYAVANRLQGADEALNKAGINSHALICTDKQFFDEALLLAKITRQEYDMVIPYVTDPIGTMNEFIGEHPDYIDEMIKNANLEICRRLTLCLSRGYYSEMPKDTSEKVLERIKVLKGTNQ